MEPLLLYSPSIIIITVMAVFLYQDRRWNTLDKKRKWKAVYNKKAREKTMNKEELEKYCAKNGPHAQLGDGVMVTNEYEFSDYFRYVGPPRATAKEALADRAFILAATEFFVNHLASGTKP